MTDGQKIQQLVSALNDARDIIATALKTTSPDWYQNDEDVNGHNTIKKIDAALSAAEKQS